MHTHVQHPVSRALQNLPTDRNAVQEPNGFNLYTKDSSSSSSSSSRAHLTVSTNGLNCRLSFHFHFFYFYGGIWKLKFLLTPSLTLTALKMQFIRRLRMLRRTLYVASWQVYMGDGSNALIVMEDISKTLYWRREAFCESKILTYLTVFTFIYCCVQ